MECIHPILIKPKDKPWRDPVKVPCNQCICCRLNRAREWSIRIMHELKMHNGVGCFLTLTYDQAHAPWVSDFRATLVKKDLQDFFKRLRKRLEPAKIRYYAVGEYGEQYGRPHYHCIVFGLLPQLAEVVVQQEWMFGFVHVGNVTLDSANYVARYCTKVLTGSKREFYERNKIIPEFSVMSRRPGIGATWLEKYGNEVKTHHSVVAKGKEYPVPRYYKDKVYDEVDRSIVNNNLRDYFIAKAKEVKKDLDNDLKIFLESNRKVGLDTRGDRLKTFENTVKTRLKRRKG